MAKALSLLLKIFLPLVAAAGIGGGSWYIYEETNPTILKAFSKKGYSWSPVSHKNIQVKKTFGVETTENKYQNLFSPKDCVNNFFPGVNWITKGFERTANEETSNKPTLNQTPSLPNKEKAYGCLVLEIGHNPDTTVGEGLALWELTLKKETHGMVLVGYAADSVFGLLSDSAQSSTTEFRWTALHLQKEGNQWRTKGGVMWDDSNTGTNDTGQTLKVNFSDQKKYEWTIPAKKPCKIKESDRSVTVDKVCVGPANWKNFGLSAIWEETTDNKGKEIFEIIDQTFGGKPGNIWGRKDFDFEFNQNAGGDELDKTRGWKSAHTILPTSEEGWKNTGTSNQDYIDYLAKVYKPFKGKKGTWTEIEEFCEKNKSLRSNSNNETVEKILNFCLVKK